MKAFENALLDSISAAACEGPNTLTPAVRSASASPAASGTSGPMMTRSIALLRCKLDESRDVISRNLDVVCRGARVARCDEQFRQPRRLRNLPGQGVFAPAGTNDQNSHIPYASARSNPVLVRSVSSSSGYTPLKQALQ